jgi:hypothetical protein
VTIPTDKEETAAMDIYTIELPKGLKLNVELGATPITLDIEYPGKEKVKFEYPGKDNGGSKITRDAGLEHWSKQKGNEKKYKNRVSVNAQGRNDGAEIEYESTDEDGNRHD